MYIFAFLLLVASFLCAIFCAGAAAVQLWQKQTNALGLVEKGGYAITGLMTMSSFVLLAAFVNNDFTVEYVARYSDRYLPLFYRMTAFWAGQEGSLLFWGWSVAIFGVFFLVSKTYEKLTAETKLWFWMFFLAIIAFFLLLITGWSNPFITFSQPVADGNGLNPLLQNPGMILHPPLTFLGYGGFVIPGCLALAQTLSGKREEEGLWSTVCRPFTVLAWLLLSAGIVLGAWWAYMELGWGGYWAWDPVENASLIPWLISTAFLHTAVVEARRGKLPRFNVFLMALTTISAFFATYIVRSGIIGSVHGFPDGGVAVPLMSFVVLATLISFLAAFLGKFRGPELASPLSREGLLLCVAVILLTLGFIVLIATLWPVLSKSLAEVIAVFSPNTLIVSTGLDATFYNRVCLPLFTLLTLVLAFCPWISWGGGFRNPRAAAALAIVFALGVPVFLLLMEGPEGFNFAPEYAGILGKLRRVALMTPQMAASAAVTVLLSLVLLFLKNRALLRSPVQVAAHGVHLGVALMVLGVAFSGPYQLEGSYAMSLGQSAALGAYEITLEELATGEGQGFDFSEATLVARKDGREVGRMQPQRRHYEKYPQQAFMEASTIFSAGDEIYGSLLRMDPQRGTAEVHVSVNPLVNWIWFGAVLLCLFPFVGISGWRKRESDAA